MQHAARSGWVADGMGGLAGWLIAAWETRINRPEIMRQPSRDQEGPECWGPPTASSNMNMYVLRTAEEEWRAGTDSAENYDSTVAHLLVCE